MAFALEQIKINPEFEALIPKTSEEEDASLRESVAKDGFRDPVVIWKETGFLLDGHRRLAIWKQSYSDKCSLFSRGPVPRIVALSFTTEDEAKEWIDRNSIARRNLTPFQISMIRGRIYDRMIGPKADASRPAERADVKLAESEGVSPKTVRNDHALYKAVNDLKAIKPDIAERLEAGDGPTRTEVCEAAKLLQNDPQEAAELLQQAEDRKVIRSRFGKKAANQTLKRKLSAFVKIIQSTARKACRSLPLATAEIAGVLRDLADELEAKFDAETTSDKHVA